jgi:GH15 family glucan-1,4-alpha-glucosidase
LAPVSGEFKNKQRYLPDTNILLTRFLGESGIAAISDFMAMQHLGNHRNLVRRVKVVRGEISFRMVCAPKFDYGRSGHTIEKKQHEVVFIPASKKLPALRLRSSVSLKVENGAAIAEFKLRSNQSASFILEEANGDSPSHHPDYVSVAFKETMNYWLAWVGRSKYRGRWREMVNRSALALKLLTSEPHGSLVAAPTFSLPESIGGKRNWDYRYTWIRDASFTLFALLRIGFSEEAARFMDWIEARCREIEPDGSLNVLYGINGQHYPREEILDHLEGYRGSKPVRIGNDACNQLQLDIYGELMDAVFLYNRDATPISYDLWDNLQRQLTWLSKHWKDPDDGLWEVRGGRQQFTYSKVMCWVAFERALRIARSRGLPVDWDGWQGARDELFTQIMTQGWNPEKRAFTQSYGSDALDASLLLLPVVKFLGPTDPRILGTIDAIEQELVADSLVYRYNPKKAAPDGLTGQEGTFSLCTFWLVEALTRAGRLDESRLVLEKMFSYANHVGLYAEQIGPSGEALGNFPQAFTHLSLITSIYNLNQALDHGSNWRGAR